MPGGIFFAPLAHWTIIVVLSIDISQSFTTLIKHSLILRERDIVVLVFPPHKSVQAKVGLCLHNTFSTTLIILPRAPNPKPITLSVIFESSTLIDFGRYVDVSALVKTFLTTD